MSGTVLDTNLMGDFMTFGGFSGTGDGRLRPQGATLIGAGSLSWRLGDAPARSVMARGGHRNVLLLGWCGATPAELRRLTDTTLPADIAWRWPGTYTVVEETPDAVVLHTDPAAALPLYAATWRDGWAWSTSARVLARLISAPVDARRLVCSVLAPSVPTLAGSRTFFDGVEQLAPGSRIELPAGAGSPRCTVQWRPDAVPGLPHHRLREALSAAVTLRMEAGREVSCDLSGGLDSTTVAVLAATSLSDKHRLNTVTIHPEGDESGADLHYARLTSAAYPDRITHHLLPLAVEHLPYTRITAVPATDEPAPSTLTRARLTGQFHWMRRHLGSRTHLTGDGGDSVLFQPPAHLADLVRHRRWRRAVNEALGWARLRRCPVTPLLRDAVAMARMGRRDALADLAVSLAGFADTSASRARPSVDRGSVRWFTLLPMPGWAEPAALRLLSEAAGRAADTEDTLTGLDASVRILVDEVREVARTAVADVGLAATCGIDLHNPFLDPRVMDTVLRTSIDHRPPVHGYKPLLGRAMRHLLPPAVAARTTKGSFDADHHAGLRVNLPELLDLADGHLSDLGLIDPGRFRRHLREAAAGIPMPLAMLEQALSAEAWLRAHHESPGPAWTDAPVGSTRANGSTCA
ncbi:albusnodin/ikarugamycin family macrolactam cyclase [Streptomyces sp. MnatMP-M17]|uniref:albusnodin/ikarugamycin family macrolactam cyclase n=1 Tax=unclassified Streptomyces TaxID=2593676 RepID=UPI002108661E|nr:albusnodin/ikarugamycin family macrolactam cyclase [Streptomyces sp. MnatMP-M17]